MHQARPAPTMVTVTAGGEGSMQAAQGIYCMTGGSRVVSGHLKCISAASLLPLPCPHYSSLVPITLDAFWCAQDMPLG